MATQKLDMYRQVKIRRTVRIVIRQQAGPAMADPQIVPFVLEPPSIGFTSWGIPDETDDALPNRVPGNRWLEDLTQGCPIQAFIPTSRLDDH